MQLHDEEEIKVGGKKENMLKLLYIQIDERRETRKRRFNTRNHKRQNEQSRGHLWEV